MRPWFSTVLVMGTVLAVSSQAHTSGAPTAPITIEGFAQVEGILSYCSTLDPSNSTKYKRALNNIISGHSATEIKNDQSSSRYTFALGVIDQGIAKLPVNTVKSSCKNFIGAK